MLQISTILFFDILYLLGNILMIKSTVRYAWCNNRKARNALLWHWPCHSYARYHAGSLWHKGAYNRIFPCMEANYPYAIQNQRGGKITVGPQPMREVKTDLISTSRSSQLWVNTRMFLVNMALSDILMCLTLPVTPYTAFTGSRW